MTIMRTTVVLVAFVALVCCANANLMDDLDERELFETDMFDRSPVRADIDEMPPTPEDEAEPGQVQYLEEEEDIPLSAGTYLDLEHEPNALDGEMQTFLEVESTASGDSKPPDDEMTDKEKKEYEKKKEGAKIKKKQKVFTIHRCRKECKGQFGTKSEKTTSCLETCLEVNQAGMAMGKAMQEMVINCAADHNGDECKASNKESRQEGMRYKQKLHKAMKLVKWEFKGVKGVRWARKRAWATQYNIGECRQFLIGAKKILSG